MKKKNPFKPGLWPALMVIMTVSLLSLWGLFADLAYTVQEDESNVLVNTTAQTMLDQMSLSFSDIGESLDESSLPGAEYYLANRLVDDFDTIIDRFSRDFILIDVEITDQNGNTLATTHRDSTVYFLYTDTVTGNQGYAFWADDVEPVAVNSYLNMYGTIYLTGQLDETGELHVATIYSYLWETDERAGYNIDEAPEGAQILESALGRYGNSRPGDAQLMVTAGDLYYGDYADLYHYDALYDMNEYSATTLQQEVTLYNGDTLSLSASVMVNPHAETANRLRPVFLLTLALVLALLLFFGWFVSAKLSQPLNGLIDDLDRNTLRSRISVSQRFIREIARLAGQYDNIRQQQSDSFDELMQLKKALTYSQEAEQSRRLTNSSVAHELKTPLAVIHGYAEALGDDLSAEERSRYQAKILAESDNMNHIVNNMLDNSRVEAGKIRLQREAFSLRELTVEVFDRLKDSMDKKSLTLAINGADVTAFADRSRIGQVITNYATNAIRHGTPGSQITVSLAQTYGQATFRIRNIGQPISPEKLSRIWEPYYQADSGGGSSGLGLSICKNIIDLHGGTVNAENLADGVEFSFRVGAQLASPTARVTSAGDSAPIIWQARLDEGPLSRKRGLGSVLALVITIVAAAAACVMILAFVNQYANSFFPAAAWILVALLSSFTLYSLLRQQKLRKMSRSALVTDGDTVTLVTYLIQNGETTCETLIGSLNVNMKNGFNTEDLLGFNLGNSGRKKSGRAHDLAVLAMQDKAFVLDKYRSGYGQVELTRRYDCTVSFSGGSIIIRGAKSPGGKLTQWTLPDVFGPVELECNS